MLVFNCKEDFIGVMYIKNSCEQFINVNIYKCNGLGAYATRQRKGDLFTTNLWGFWADKEHLKNMLGINKSYKDLYENELSKITFIKPLNNDTKKIIMTIGNEFVKKGYKVIYNADIKEVIYND